MESYRKSSWDNLYLINQNLNLEQDANQVRKRASILLDTSFSFGGPIQSIFATFFQETWVII